MTLPDVPLIEHIGTVEIEPMEMDSRLLFDGTRNFYENVEICWRRKVRIHYLDGEHQQEDLDAEEWKGRWKENLPLWNKVKWKQRPRTNVAMSELIPADYLLEDRLGNLAVESGPGPNGGNAGFDPDYLPTPYRAPDTATERPGPVPHFFMP